jgi:hypothetical protein
MFSWVLSESLFPVLPPFSYSSQCSICSFVWWEPVMFLHFHCVLCLLAYVWSEPRKFLHTWLCYFWFLLLGEPRKCEDWCNDGFLDSSLSHISGMQVVESFIITSWLGGSSLSLSSSPFLSPLIYLLLWVIGFHFFHDQSPYPDLRLLTWYKLGYLSGLFALFASGISSSSLALESGIFLACFCLFRAANELDADPHAHSIFFGDVS